MEELREAFDPHGFILSADVSAKKPVIEREYDIPKLNDLLDFMNVVAYDFHGAWEPFTGHNAPLHPHPNDTLSDRQNSVEAGVDHWLNNGADPKKIVRIFLKLLNIKEDLRY